MPGSLLLKHSLCTGSRQHSPSEAQGRHLPHRQQWVQALQRVVVFAPHVQRPVPNSAVARLHPLSTAPQAGVLLGAAEAHSRVRECHTLSRRQPCGCPVGFGSFFGAVLRHNGAVSQPTEGIASGAFCRSVRWQCNRRAARVRGNPCRTTRRGSPLLFQMIISLRPSIILPTGSVFQYRSARSCSAHILGRGFSGRCRRREDASTRSFIGSLGRHHETP